MRFEARKQRRACFEYFLRRHARHFHRLFVDPSMKKPFILRSGAIMNLESGMLSFESPDACKHWFSASLRTCTDMRVLLDGMLLHNFIVKHGDEKDVYLSSLLVHMYGKCGALYDARGWFGRIHERSIFSWNCLIGVYIQHGHSIESCHFFEQMQQECVLPNSSTFSNMLSSCTKNNSKAALKSGLQLHARIVYSDLDSDMVVQTALINMYSKCGKLPDARGVFNTMYARDTVTWNAMLGAIVLQSDGDGAIQFFSQMQLESILWDKYTCVTMFSACATHRTTVRTGKEIHACISASGLEMNSVLILSLINMYAKTGLVCHAKTVFESSLRIDAVLWNVMITAYGKNDDGRCALQLFDRLYQEGLIADKVTFLNIVSELANHMDIHQGWRVHACVNTSVWNSDVQIQTALLHMYGKLGDTDGAQKIFDDMVELDVVCWNSVISVYVCHGLSNVAFQHFDRMQQEGHMPNSVTVTSILSGCMDLALPFRKRIHASIIKSEIKHDLFVGNALISLYCKYGHLKDAHEQFNSMVSRDIITWNTLIGGYAQSDYAYFVIHLFNKMCMQGVAPDQATYVSMFAAFGNDSFSVSNNIELSPPLSHITSSSYFTEEKKQLIRNGEEVPTIIDDKIIPDNNQHLNTATKSMSNFFLHPYRDSCIYEGKLLHAHIMSNGLDLDSVIANSVLKFYGKCGGLRDAQNIFEKLPKRDVLSFTAMIAAYSLQHFDIEAVQTFERMISEGVSPDNVTFIAILEVCANMESLAYGFRMHNRLAQYGCELDVNLATALVNLYAKCHSLIEAKLMFDQLPKRDLIAWTSMIVTLIQFAKAEEALQLFWQMQWDGLIPDVIVLTNVLNACEIHLSLLDGRMIHTCIEYCCIESDVDLATSLIFMYGKCGSLSDAEAMFCKFSEKSVGLWNAIIASYAQHGCGKEALKLVYCMDQQQSAPNKTTFVIILSACSRAGLLDEAYLCLFLLFQVHMLTPSVEHIDCMVDVLARVGYVDDAEILMNSMPFLPTVVSWAAFMAACTNQIDVRRGSVAVNHLVEMDPVDPATYVAFSNLYAAAGGIEYDNVYHENWIDHCESSDVELLSAELT